MAYSRFLNGHRGDTTTPNTSLPPWQPTPLEEILDSSLTTSRDTPPSGGVTFQGFIFHNPKVVNNLRRLESFLYQLGADNFRVSGGDRYVDSQGNHRSATNNQIISGSARTSPHLMNNGARAADVVVVGVSDTLFHPGARATKTF